MGIDFDLLSRRSLFAAALVSGAAFSLALAPLAAHAQASPDRKVSQPVVHENLAIYFVRGPSAPGPVPLTLAEAMQRGSLIVHETGDVNSLQVENKGAEPVFIQSGDIVKGGKQDRVLTVSLIVPPQSGKMPIDAFCVEQGRWSARGREQVAQFEASNAAIPSRAAKLAMKAPIAPSEATGSRIPQPQRSDTSTRQSQVWAEVSRKQESLARAVGAPVAAAQSRTSLQLTLENEKLNTARAAYLTALKTVGDGDGEIVGFVFAINGKINSGDVYASNGLFRKMWPKMLEAAVTEALGERPETDKTPAPDMAAVTQFLAGAEQGTASTKTVGGSVELETRTGREAHLYDTRLKAGALVHRNYLRAN